MTEQTPRLNTPYIISTQSQKEVTHNMALNMLDALVQPVVETAVLLSPPPVPFEGGVWIVSSPAAGDWSGHDHELAQYIGGAWHFYAGFEGMSAWLKDDAVMVRFSAGAWQQGVVRAARVDIAGEQVLGARQGGIDDAAGGAVIDAEARAALNALLAACRAHGLIAPS